MINWGIIGYGRIARRFVENLHCTSGNLYAIASASFQGSMDDVVIYHDYYDLLNDENVDIVYIAMPHFFHYQWVKEAIRHHKAVLCEKPLVLTVEECESLIQLQKQEQVLVAEALKTRFIPTYQALKEDISKIGKIEEIHCGFCYYKEKDNSYLFDPRQGGALNDVGSYMLGFVLDLMPTKAATVEAENKYRDEVDVHFNAVLTFEDGAKAYVEGAMDEKKDSTGIIKGTKGTITIPYYYRPGSYRIEMNDGTMLGREYDLDLDMSYEIEAMNKAKEAGLIEIPDMTLKDSLEIVEMIEEIRRAGKR